VRFSSEEREFKLQRNTFEVSAKEFFVDSFASTELVREAGERDQPGDFRSAKPVGVTGGRAATSLALLYLSGRSGEARAVLEPALEQFKQGYDTRDVQAAISVLFAPSG
jgi:hypothetical protein